MQTPASQWLVNTCMSVQVPVCLFRCLSVYPQVPVCLCWCVQVPAFLHRFIHRGWSSMLRTASGTCLSLVCLSLVLVPVYPSLQVCSGWSQVIWRLPQDTLADGVVVENQGSSSVLQLSNVTWRNSGRYTCEEVSSHQSRDINIFIPGRGNHHIYLIWIISILCMRPVSPDVSIKPVSPQVQRSGLSHWAQVWS